MKDKVMIFLAGISAVPLVWILLSWIDVVVHNCGNELYSSWNLFQMFLSGF